MRIITVNDREDIGDLCTGGRMMMQLIFIFEKCIFLFAINVGFFVVKKMTVFVAVRFDAQCIRPNQTN